MYDTNGIYLKETKLVNLTLRTGYLEDNLEYITQGAFRQPCAKYDYVVDPDVSCFTLILYCKCLYGKTGLMNI